MKSHCDCGWVAVADLEVQIADTAIEREFVGIDDGLARSGTPRGKLQHVSASAEKFVAFLVSRGLRSKKEYRAVRAVPNQPYPRPQVDRAADPIPSLRNKDHAFSRCLLHAIDGGLDRCRIVRLPVRSGAEAAALQVDRMRVI